VSDHVTDRLSAYLDGALGVTDLEYVRGHIETCPACLHEFEELRALRSLLRQLPEPVAPEGFAERVRWRLQREAGRRVRVSLRDVLSIPLLRPTAARWALAGAALLLVVGLPLGWLAGRAAHETPLDADLYLRDYLVLSIDRPLTDEATTTLVSSTVFAPEPPTR
jgi:anti-sigma factor RsiW